MAYSKFPIKYLTLHGSGHICPTLWPWNSLFRGDNKHLWTKAADQTFEGPSGRGPLTVQHQGYKDLIIRIFTDPPDGTCPWPRKISLKQLSIYELMQVSFIHLNPLHDG